jgi:beta-glucosidase
MTKRSERATVGVVAAIGLAAFALARTGAAAPARCPWLDPHLPIAQRVALLLQRMTVGEMIRMVAGNGKTHPYVGNIPGDRALCIPPLGLEDGPNGVADGVTGATALPSGASLAATFSRRLAYEYGRVIGAEQAAKGSAVVFGPTVNIDRDPRWGREFESLSEDPRLTAALAVAEIRGMQSRRVIAQVKHFDVYNQETHRNTPRDSISVSRRVLHEIYMPAFRSAIIRGKAGSVMCAYSTVNGHYSCQSHYLLTRVLRGEWNFDGFVTSDYGAVHSIAAAEAGTDMEQPFNHFFGAPLRLAVRRGTVSRAVLNTMAARILYQMFRFDYFRHPPSGSIGAMVTTPAHQDLSTRVAAAGTVLLKNDHHLLPLSRTEGIAVIGPAASTQVAYAGGGSAHVVPSSTVTPLAGIEAVAGSSAVTYAQGLPADEQLRPIPAGDLSKPYRGTIRGQRYSATLTPPQTGTYIIALTNGCGCYKLSSLAIDGRTLINDPGTPPVATFSAAIHLERGRPYQVTVTGPTDRLAWAEPTAVRADIQAAVKAAKSARVAVVVVADDTESEGADRPDLRLPSAQDELVRAVAKANPRTVVVVQAGEPVGMPWRARAAAILDTWYPGQTDGTALANVLFGTVDPSGHLPVTFPARLADVPAASRARFPGIGGKVDYSEGLLVGYRWYDARHIAPMFPFGFGLSYTHFRFSDLRLSRRTADGVTPIRLRARITNDGKVTGTDVAQLYLGMPASTGEPPRQLIDFHRVTLAPGESQVVRFTITPRDEWWWAHGRWSESAGTYRVFVGDSSALANLPLTARYRIESAIGGRQVTVAAPKRLEPGKRAVVRVSLTAGGNETLHAVRVSLQAPAGWRVVPLDRAPRELKPSEGATERFAVTPPSWAVTQYVTLYGTADLSPRCARHGGKVVLLGGASPERPGEVSPAKDWRNVGQRGG